MECHRCPNRKKIENGEFARVAYSKTPCAKCELKENSDLTMEYDAEKEVRTQDSGLRGQRESASGTSATGTTADMEEVLPISVMNEVIVRLMSMTPETRDAVCWRFLGMGYRDIAHLQGVTTAAVEKRHWKAMKKWPALCALFAMKTAKHGSRKPMGKPVSSGQLAVARRGRRR
jgi:hypothetical protein